MDNLKKKMLRASYDKTYSILILIAIVGVITHYFIPNKIILFITLCFIIAALIRVLYFVLRKDDVKHGTR